jgi:hypothetical protein
MLAGQPVYGVRWYKAHTFSLDVYHRGTRVGHVGGVVQPLPRSGTRRRRCVGVAERARG